MTLLASSQRVELLYVGNDAAMAAALCEGLGVEVKVACAGCTEATALAAARRFDAILCEALAAAGERRRVTCAPLVFLVPARALRAVRFLGAGRLGRGGGRGGLRRGRDGALALAARTASGAGAPGGDPTGAAAGRLRWIFRLFRIRRLRRSGRSRHRRRM